MNRSIPFILLLGATIGIIFTAGRLYEAAQYEVVNVLVPYKEDTHSVYTQVVPCLRRN